MKLTYLGTAAAEGFPAVFCNCKYCQEAARLGGKNIRTRSQALVNDELLLDLPADTYHHFLQHGIAGHKIKYLFVTHSHSDHLYPLELGMRSSPVFSKDALVPVLQVYCGEGPYARLKSEIPEENGFHVNPVEPFRPVVLDGYTVTPLPARHAKGDGALFYLIQGDKTLLYAHDTGYFYDEVLDWLRDSRIHADLISLDCTNIDIPIPDTGSHMGIANNQRLLAALEAIGVADENTIRYVNHFSHNAAPLHDRLEKRAAEIGCRVSYDGHVVHF